MRSCSTTAFSAMAEKRERTYKVVQVCVSPEDHADLAKRANEAQMALSEYCRDLILQRRSLVKQKAVALMKELVNFIGD